MHQDISGRNILITSDINVKICEFGSFTLVGESQYGLAEFRYHMERFSPEWERTFLYDLLYMGALFYEIILGGPPYGKLNRAEVEE